jgi:predicted molibdopterin-dependent oxidoreductase YjgC
MTLRRPRLAEGPGLRRGPLVALTIDGRPATAYLGESVAAALLADGADDLSTRTTRAGDARGVFCGMGVCFDCLVVVDGVPGTRACVTWVRDGMTVSRQDGPGYPRNRPPEASGAAPG